MAKIDIDDCIDLVIEALDFDHLFVFADALGVEIEYPPIDDMYPDWENEIRTETGDELRKAIHFEYPKEFRQLQAENERQADLLLLAKEQMDAQAAENKRLRKEIEVYLGTVCLRCSHLTTVPKFLLKET